MKHLFKKAIGQHQRYLRTSVGLAILASTALSLTTLPVYAAEDAPADPVASANETETIVVTARRRKENVQDVPIAITTLGGAQIEDSGAYRLDQIKQLVPSVQTLTFNPRNANVSIRGLGGNVAITNDGLEQGVGYYIDDVYYGRTGQSQFDLVDLAQVEVLRGPQGTLFGKNTTAGAINITTREPSFTPEGSFELGGGTYGFAQIKGGYSAPIIDGKLAFRATAALTQRDGYITNVRTHRDLHDYENATVRFQLLATPTEKLKIRVIADYGVQRQECCIAVWAGTVTTRANGTPLPNGFAARAARIGYTPLVGFDAFAREVDIDGTARTAMNQSGISAKVDYEFDNLTFTSVTAARRWNWTPSNDADGIGAPVLLQGRIIDHQKQFSQEFRVASKGHQRVDWVAGAYYFWQAVDGFQTSWFGPDAAWYNLPPVLYSTPAQAALAKAALTDYQLYAYSRPESKSAALFGQATWNVNDKFNVTGGLRYTKEKKRGDFNQVVSRSGSLAGYTTAEQTYINTIRGLVGGANSYVTRLDESNVSGLLTAAYKITPTVLAYGTVSKGYKSGGLNLSNLATSVPKTVDPEKVKHAELGLKSTWLDKSLTANISLYRTDIDGYQTTVFDTTRVTTYIDNVGSIRSQGAEIDLKYAPTSSLKTYLGIAYSDAKYVSYPNAPAPIEYTGLLPSTANYIDVSGRPLPGSSKWTVSLGGEYNFALPNTDKWGGYVGADYNTRSKYYASVNDSASSLIDGYGILNARIGLRSADGLKDISFWARNATDTKYFETLGGGNAGQPGLITGLVGAPRTVGITYRQRFGS